MAERQVFAGHGSGRDLKLMTVLILMPILFMIPLILFSFALNIAGVVIIMICVMIGLMVYHVYTKNPGREVGDRAVVLDGSTLTLFIEKESAWTVGLDDIADVRFRQGERLQYGRDRELVITDRRTKEHVLSEFDDLEEKTLRELFGALKERLEGKDVVFGSGQDMARQADLTAPEP